MDKWHYRFMEMAWLVATWSKDPSTQVGAVAVSPCRRKIATGYNGFPSGMDDSPERYADRTIKYPRVLHAEANAILNAPFPLDGCILFVTHRPCLGCASMIIQAGFSRVVVPHNMDNRWADEQFAAKVEIKNCSIGYEEVGV